MKKLLALVLALVMVMGLSVVSTNAAFKDEESIDHTEAVEVMNALNIINGYEDGSYKPDLNVTRAQMAKMVAIAVLGEIDPAAFAGAKSDLTDISGHWAEGYIKFCVSQGIIAGRGNGIFDPEANVTTAEASKMLLVALGYNADVRKYTGSQWTLNVMRDAQQKGLLDELTKAGTNNAMDRDDAAQIIYNTLTARRVIETQSVNTETGAITLTYVDATAGQNGVTAATVNLLGKTFDASAKIGYLTGIAFDTNKKVWTYTFNNTAQFASPSLAAETDAITDGKTLKTTDDYADLYGQKVKVVYDNDDNTVVYGVYADEDSKVLATFESGAISASSIDTTANTAKIDGVKYKFDDVDGNNYVYDYRTGLGGTFATALATKDVVGLAADTTAWTAKLIDNDDDEKVDCVVVSPMTLVKINYVGSETFTATTLGTQQLADFAQYGIARNDYAWYTDQAHSKYDEPILLKAELKTAKVSGTRTAPEYQLNGEWYEVGTGGALAVAGLANNDEVEYVAHGGYLYYAKVAEAAATTKDVAVVISTDDVTATGTKAASLEGKLIFADGTKKTVTIAKVNDTAVTTQAAAKAAVGTAPGAAPAGAGISGVLFTYRVNSDGDYELTAVSTTNLAGQKAFIGAAAADYNTKGVSATGAAGGAELADDAVVFVWSGAAYGTAAGANAAKVYTGKEIKNTFPTTKISTASANAAALTNVDNGFTYAKIVVLHNTAALTITTGSNYAYLTANAFESVENDKTYTNYTYWDGTSEKTAKEEANGKLATMKSGAIVTYDTTSTEGVIKNVTVVNAKTGIITGWDGSSKIQLAGETASKVTSDTKLLIVNSETKKGVAGDVSSIQLGNDLNNDDVPDQANVRYIGVTADNVDLLVVDANNEMKAGPAMSIAGTATSSAAITAALSSSNDVTVTGAATVDTAIVIASGKTLTFTGALTLSADVTGAGTLVAATFTNGATSTAHIKNSHVEITAAATKAEVVAVANKTSGNTLKLDAPTSDNVATADGFFATNGTAVDSAAAPAGTYTYYAGGDFTNTSGPTGNTVGWWTATAKTAYEAS